MEYIIPTQQRQTPYVAFITYMTEKFGADMSFFRQMLLVVISWRKIWLCSMRDFSISPLKLLQYVDVPKLGEVFKPMC